MRDTMNSSLRMNNFLQRMLKKSDDESDGDTVTYDNARQRVECSPRSGKSNWMRKLGAYSPSGRSPSRPITPKPAGHRGDYRRRIVPDVPAATEDSVTNAEMPDLEKIIHEFEEGFMSPTKHEIKETVKSGRFVKQIVAAFEEKYKERNDYKMLSERSSNELDDDRTMRNDDTTVELEMSEISESAQFLGRTYVIETLENRLSHYQDFETKSSFSQGSDDSIDLATCTFAMDEELIVSTPAKKLPESSTRRSIHDPRSIDPRSIDSPRHGSATLRGESPKARSKPLLRSNSSLRRERQPTIVGAFLKKPIEVEDTSIDWIPITGKKLPRKKSFKRLLSVLTGKKSSEKSSKLYCSQVNLQEENSRELHDSGYDEKSCSSSSLASLVSFTDLLLHQENPSDFDRRQPTMTFQQQSNPIDIDANRRNVGFTTFRSASPTPSEPKNRQPVDDFADDVSDTCSVASSRNMLLLEEVPRSEVRLSLGPAFPSGPRFIDVKSENEEENIYSTLTTCNVTDFSVDQDATYETLPEAASPLPKHPFVSAKYEANLTAFEADKDVNFNYLGKVELRRDLTFPQVWTFPSNEVTYDVPRRFLSKSEPGLATIGREKGTNILGVNEVIYDVPRPKIPPRPRSSVYEDALSLKRRNEHLGSSSAPPASGFYAFPSTEEPHYATVKPRNTRICPSRELMRSVGDLSGRDNRADFYGRQFDGARNF